MPGVTHAIGIPFGASGGYSATPVPAGTTYHETLVADAATAIDVGSSITDLAIIVTYCATRGSGEQMGTIFILNSTLPDFNWDCQGDDIGITLVGTSDATNIYVQTTVDNSSVDDVTFDYIVEIITLT